MALSTLCVGADIHRKDITLRGVDKATEEEVLPRCRVANNLPGAQSAVATIARAATEGGYAHLVVGWEATGMLWLPFHQTLSSSPLLEPFALDLVCLNPKLVHGFKDSLVLRHPKNDDRDARDIAARLSIGRLPVSYVPSGFWQGLRRLTRYRFQLSRELSREKNRFQSSAFLKASEWNRSKPFGDVFGATSAALLTEFTAAQLRDMTHDQLADLIARRGHGAFHDPAATARAVQEALRASYPIDPQMDEMVTTALATTWEHIRFIDRLMRHLDRQICHAIQPVPNPLITVKGLGQVISAGILAEIAEVPRFPEHRHLAQYSGLTWERRSSGGAVYPNARLTKVGNVYLRYYLIIGADRMRQSNLDYQAYYWRKYNEVTKNQHKRALVLTARKLVRLVHALLTKNMPYVRPRMPTSSQEVDLLE